MKEKARSISKSLPPVRIYLEDVREIYDILKKVCKEVRIETDRYEFADLNSLTDIGQDEIHELHIEGSEPRITVELRPFDGSLYASHDTPVSKGVLTSIHEVLNKRERKTVRVYITILSTWLALLSAVILTGLSWLILVFTERLLTILLLSSLWGLCALAYIYGYRESLHRHSTVVLSEKRLSTSFFIRNRDRIFVGVLIAVISSLITFLLTKFLS